MGTNVVMVGVTPLERTDGRGRGVRELATYNDVPLRWRSCNAVPGQMGQAIGVGDA